MTITFPLPPVAKPRQWAVVSPEYGTVIPVLDDGSGPMEYQSDVVLVETSLGPREAVRCAVLLWTRGIEPAGYLDPGWENPYAGVEAHPCEIDPEEGEYWIWERHALGQ